MALIRQLQGLSLPHGGQAALHALSEHGWFGYEDASNTYDGVGVTHPTLPPAIINKFSEVAQHAGQNRVLEPLGDLGVHSLGFPA